MKSRTATSTQHTKLQEVLRNRGVKFDRSTKIIDRLMGKCGHIVQNNPQRKYRFDRPSIDAMQHYSQSEFSMNSDDQKQKIPPRALPRIESRSESKKQIQFVVPLSHNQILALRARKFVSRVRKQKQYEEGKAMVRRKNQQKKKQKQLQIQQKERQKQREQYMSQKHNSIIDNILYHQERIGFRLKRSIRNLKKPRLRSKTQGSNEAVTRRKGALSAKFEYDDCSSPSSTKGRMEPIIIATLKKRLTLLQSMISSLQQ